MPRPRLTPEARAARAKYMREWRKKNPDKVQEYDLRKWEKKADRIRQEREAAEDIEKGVSYGDRSQYAEG